MVRNICVDIDGTLTDPYHFIPYLNEITGKNITEKDYISTDWNVIFGEEFKDEYAVFDDKYRDSYFEAKLVNDSKRVVDRMKDNNDNIYIVTARSSSIDEVTEKWLSDMDIKYDKLVSLGGNEGKVNAAKRLGCDIFIEDDPDNAMNLAKSGIKVILLENNYNNWLKHENITMVKNWKEVEKLVFRQDI